ncbi:MAG: class I SAM-dependent methyltransferase [Ignavibacteriales bacterium]
MSKEKVVLEEEKETLLVTLYCKALESKKPKPVIFDDKAVELVDRIEYDYSRLRIPSKTQVTLCLRAKQMDNYVLGFLAENPEGIVVNLGCGLDSRSDRLDNGTAYWYDLDFPEVIQLRRRFYTETERKKMIPSPVTAPEWLEAVARRRGRFLFVAEGLLMYLREGDVRDLFLRLRQRLPGSRLLADVFSKLTVRNLGRHPSISRTGAEVYWGVDDFREILQWCPGIGLIEEWHFARSEELAKLSFGYRLAMRLAGAFSVVNKAHRILFLQL